jgi:hypothetical protein
LSDAAVIKLIATYFVPVALNRHEMDRDKGEVGEFYHSAYKQAPQYQGLWLVAPDGRVLADAGRHRGADRESWPKVVLADLKAGLAKFGTVEPRRASRKNLHPYKGLGVRPDGSVVLAVTQKGLNNNAELSKFNANSWLPPAIIDGMPLSAAEWSALAPKDAELGSQWSIPENVGQLFFRYLSGDIAMLGGDITTKVLITGRVASVRDGVALLAYRGQIEGDCDGTKSARNGLIYSTSVKMIDGIGAFDVKTGQMLSLTMVWDGLLWPFRDPSQPRKAPGRFGAVVEWRREATRG